MNKGWAPVTIVFAVVTLFCIFMRTQFAIWGIDINVVLFANSILFAVTIIASLMYAKALKSKKPYTFVNNMYGGFMLKFLALLISVGLYISLAKQVNKPGVILGMGLYMVYTILGVWEVMKNRTRSRMPKL